jgi:hypothetical protein
MVIFSHHREDLEIESRTRRTHFSSFNMKGANQSKSTSPSSIGEADFDCKYPEYVSLINLTLFILKKFFLGFVSRYAYFD